MRGASAGGGEADDARERPQAMPLDRRARGDDDRRRAVVDARGVARRHRAALAKRRRQRGELFQTGLARMLVMGDDRQVALAILDLDGRDLARQPAALLRGGGARLAAQRERVLVGASTI